MSANPTPSESDRFDRLVREQRRPLERFVRGLGARPEDAEEVAATALLRAYQSGPITRDTRASKAWLRTVARNVWIDTLRRQRIRLVDAGATAIDAANAAPAADHVAEAAREAREVCAAIALLPPAQRAVIYLREVRGLSYGEISQTLNTTEAAVTSTLHRARASIQATTGTRRNELLALAGVPVAWMRRGLAAVAHHASVAGSAIGAAKLAVPLALLAATGSIVAVTQRPAARQDSSRLVSAAPSQTGAHGRGQTRKAADEVRTSTGTTPRPGVGLSARAIESGGADHSAARSPVTPSTNHTVTHGDAFVTPSAPASAKPHEAPAHSLQGGSGARGSAAKGGFSRAGARGARTATPKQRHGTPTPSSTSHQRASPAASRATAAKTALAGAKPAHVPDGPGTTTTPHQPSASMRAHPAETTSAAAVPAAAASGDPAPPAPPASSAAGGRAQGSPPPQDTAAGTGTGSSHRPPSPT